MVSILSHYELLGVRQDASEQEIRRACEDRLRRIDDRAWRARLMRMFGSDRWALERARDTLLDPRLRAAHDREVASLLPVCPPA